MLVDLLKLWSRAVVLFLGYKFSEVRQLTLGGKYFIQSLSRCVLRN